MFARDIWRTVKIACINKVYAIYLIKSRNRADPDLKYANITRSGIQKNKCSDNIMRVELISYTEKQPIFLWWNLSTLPFKLYGKQPLFQWWNLNTLSCKLGSNLYSDDEILVHFHVSYTEKQPLFQWRNLSTLQVSYMEKKPLFQWRNLSTLQVSYVEKQPLFQWWNLSMVHVSNMEKQILFQWWNLSTLSCKLYGEADFISMMKS